MLVRIGRRGTQAQRPYQERTTPAFLAVQARSVVAGRPLFAHLYVENRCHLRCAHCYETDDTFPPHRFDDALSLADYDRVFTQLASLGVLVVTFSGGEPFLRRDLLELIGLARRHRFAVRVYTSGTLIDEDRADALRALLVSEVHVSVYSHDAAVHDAFTGIPGSHARSVRALRLLRERGVRTVLKANVTTFNVDALDELLALANDVGADWQLDPTLKPRMDGDRAPLRFAVSADELARKVLSEPRYARYVSLEEAEGLCDGDNPRRGADGGMCAAATGLIAIHADGGVAPCAMFPVVGGNVRAQSLDEIWHSSELFASVRAQRFDEMNECPRCDVRAGCSPCMAYALVEHGDARACNASSRQLATASHLHAKRLVRATQKAARGRALPLVGDVSVDALRPENNSKRSLSVEP